MSIGIVGAGAIGLLLAYELSQTTKVSLYVRRKSQLTSIEEHGLLLKGTGSLKDNICLKEGDSPWSEDLMIVCVKQPDLPQLLEKHQTSEHPDQAVLFIQNGMGHLPLIEKLQFPHLYVGVVEHGVRKENDYTIDWSGKGRIRCGTVKGHATQLTPLIKNPHLKVELVKDWRPILEDKLLVNAIINPLTALYKVENGQLVDNPFFYKLAHSVFFEVVESLNLPQALVTEKWQYILGVAAQTANNRSSMLQDLEAGRPTEIEAILGYILKENKKNASPLTLPLVCFLYDSIKGLEVIKQNR